MKTNKMKIFFSLSFFLVFTAINGFLLYSSKFSSTESITFFALCSVISLMILFASEIQEFSIAGNIVKLKEVRKDVDKAIAELQKSRIGMFNLLLEISKKYSGGFASASPKDERLDDFFLLYENIEESNLIENVSEKMIGCLEQFMKAQLYACNYYSNVKTDRDYTPDELTNEALKSDNIHKNQNNTEEENRILVLEAISYYRRLYEILQRIKSNP